MVKQYPRRAKDLESLGAVFGLSFPSNSKHGNYIHKIFFIKS